MSTLRIGIVSETLVQQHYLKHAVEDTGYSVVSALLVSELSDQATMNGIDAWVVDVNTERLDGQSQSRIFQEWLSSIDEPIIFGEGNTYNAAESYFISWVRQLKKKLLSLDGQFQLMQHSQVRANNIWVLAASTGGLDVVKRFLDVIPKDVDLALIYVQHIDHMQHDVLSHSVARDSHYHGCVAKHGDVLTANKVVIIPADRVIEFQVNGSIVEHPKQQWRGVYTPSVDQVIANVANVYGDCSGVIFFTGMGDDGAMGCRLMSLKGGQVWVQSPQTCTATSMPEAAINTGYVSKIDTPDSLAIHLKAHLKRGLEKHFQTS